MALFFDRYTEPVPTAQMRVVTFRRPQNLFPLRTMPIEIVEGVVSLLSLIRSGGGLSCSITGFERLDLQPIPLLLLCGVPPLWEVLGVVLSDDDFDQGGGKSSGEGPKVGGIVEVDPCTEREPFEGCDVLVDFAFLHAQVLHLILGSLAFRVVDECVEEFTGDMFPGTPSHEDPGVSFRSVEPFVHSFCPPLDLWSFDEG